ncbi:hypothetical protein [uncultured Parabacteroides sp.]|uniref:beta-propeller domain-containing protein n=1 Tax=uncultured Parabacteroides sp. TaxID=512312 RepID=UPI00263882D3|nr:hypothetical protein [uncultured Parabacteroides sp.]
MKIYTFILSACLLLLCPACYGVSRYLLLGGSGWDKIAIVNKNSKKIEWEHPLEKGWECNSVAVTPDGNILFSYSKGAKLITRDHKEIWNIAAPEGCEMQTARVLPNGNYLLAWCGCPATIMEVNAKGEILSRTELDTGIDQPHAQFRQVNKNERGNYLVPLFVSSEIREISPSGQFVKSVKVDGNPFCVAALDNGNYLVACGDAHCFVELNFETEKVVRKVNASDIEGGRLFFVAQLLPIHGGSLYICNWQGHDGEAAKGHYPQLIEINEVGKIVWELNDNATFGMISSICPID